MGAGRYTLALSKAAGVGVAMKRSIGWNVQKGKSTTSQEGGCEEDEAD